MCHEIRRWKNNVLFIEDGGLLFGLKSIRFVEGMLVASFFETVYTVFRKDDKGFWVKTLTRDAVQEQEVNMYLPVVSEQQVRIAQEQGVDPAQVDVSTVCSTSEIRAGMHVAPFLCASPPPSMTCVVAFERDDIVFFDGYDVSVAKFCINGRCVELADRYIKGEVGEYTAQLLYYINRKAVERCI